MPYLLSQHRLFEAAAHNPEVARRKGIPMQTAARLAGEGVKPADPRRRVVDSLMARRPQGAY